MPTTAQQQYSGLRVEPVYRPNLATSQSVNLIPSTTFPKGTLLGELTGTPGTFKAYASGNVDGSQIPKCILEYGCTTDASGNITSAGEFSQTSKGAPAWMSGYFKTTDIAGLDAGAITAMAGALVSGVLASGIIRF